MRSSVPPRKLNLHSRQGIALVIVLAFILLLTGLVVAFFSRAINERQISNSSVNQVKVDVLAQGAVDTILGDFKQEIAAGSTGYPLPAPTPAQGSATIFMPGIPANASASSAVKSATMVPAVVLPSPAPSTVSGPSGLENLVKQSAGGQPFYVAMPPSQSIAIYDTSKYPPSTRAAKSASGSGTAPENSTSTPSLNGRYISAARWNKPLLLPAKGATDFTPTIASNGTFVPPDWVVVARDGSNPTAWNAALTTGLGASSGKTSAAVGRFAYNIYDEGGLLDANVAGFPSPPSPLPAVTGTTAGRYGLYKNALAYADLTQLKGMTGNQLLTTAQIDALVGWRNNASANAPGAFPIPGFTDNSRDSYYSSIAFNYTGFRNVGSSALSTMSKQSDRMFPSRQSLISLMQAIATQIPGSDMAKVQDSLRFLGTFSRELNQPSFVRAQSVDSTAPGYDTTAPKILDPKHGGNNAGGDTTSGAAWNPALDNQINPAFLAVRALTAFTRNDGTNAVVGEPLVKKRFALNRLAWLSHVGPSADNMGDPTVQSTITAMGGNPALTTDPVYQFVKQGTAKNIGNYFGLTWGGGVWTYNAHTPPGPIMKVGRPLSVTAPDPSKYVQDAGREPDFFELLKAAVNSGSIAKASSLPPSSGYRIPHFIAQYETDSRVDDAILQMGANIIDQFDLDSYPTRIGFNDSTGAKEFRGVENLPYLYRVHPAVVKVVPPVGSPTNYYADSDTVTTSGLVTDTGLGATLLIPELWNPHDWDGANLNQTQGVAGPTNFQIYAQSDSPVIMKAAYGTPGAFAAGDSGNGSTTAGVSDGYYTRGFSWTGETHPVSAANSAMTFTIPRGGVGPQLFREPTVLFQPGKPSGTFLTSLALASPGASLGKLAGVSTAFANQGLIAAVGDSSAAPYPPVQGQSYIGFYLGATPLIWKNTSGNTVYRSRYVTLDETIYPHGVQFGFYLQYKDTDGTWVTFDEKHVTVGHKGIGNGKIAEPMHQPWAGFLQPTFDGDRHYFVLDPRTSRFGMQTSSIPAANGTNPTVNTLTWSFPPFSNTFTPALLDGYPRYLSQSEGIMSSLRDGWGLGVNVMAINNDSSPTYDLVPYNFPTVMGYYPGNDGSASAPHWTWTNAQYSMRIGLFSQNTTFTMYADRLNGDVQWLGSGAGCYGQTIPQFYTDADGVDRRAMGGWADKMIGGKGPHNGSLATVFSGAYAELMGLPMRVAHKVANGQLVKTDILGNYPPSAPSSSAPLLQAESRPMILNRPFRSTAELGYTFSGTPWKNLNLDMPESGDAALLDVFCVNDTDSSDGLVAGKVNLNTRQQPVLKAIIAGGYKDELNLNSTTAGVLADSLANRLVGRTSGVVPAGTIISGTAAARPLQFISDLVGRWTGVPMSASLTPTRAFAPPYDPTSFDGFSADIANPLYSADPTQRTPNSDPTDDPVNTYAIIADKTVGRARTAPIRALTNAGQTRVWNLLIDVVAQTGRYPSSATALNQFTVEGERRYWVHVAIDRFTGDVLDKQIEIVQE